MLSRGCGIERIQEKMSGRSLGMVEMTTLFSGRISASTSFTWDDERPVVSSVIPNRAVITTQYAKTTLPAPNRVDMTAELAIVRRVLSALRADENILIDIALDEACHHLKKEHPDADKIGAALQRALDFASRNENFEDRMEVLTPPLRQICAWLGGPWYRLLGFVGLTF